jgi:hypothetical protein
MAEESTPSLFYHSRWEAEELEGQVQAKLEVLMYLEGKKGIIGYSVETKPYWDGTRRMWVINTKGVKKGNIDMELITITHDNKVMEIILKINNGFDIENDTPSRESAFFMMDVIGEGFF